MRELCLDPTGKWLAFSTESSSTQEGNWVTVLDASSGKSAATIRSRVYAPELGFSSLGDRLVICSGGSHPELYQYRLPKGTIIRGEKQDIRVTGLPRVSADGSQIVGRQSIVSPLSDLVATHKQELGILFVHPIDDQHHRSIVTSHQSPITSFAFNPDSTRLFSGDSAGVLKISDPNFGIELISVQVHENPIVEILVSENQRTLCARSSNEIRVFRTH